jgi:signal transduction histidine kinase
VKSSLGPDDFAETPCASEGQAAAVKLLTEVGHEIKNPLSAVLSFAELMAMDAQHPLDAQRRAQLEAIGEIARHMLSIVNGTIEMARADAPWPAAADTPVDVSRIASEVLCWMTPSAKAADVSLSCQTSIGYALAQVQAVRQVLIGLVSNAIEFNRPGGHVQVRVETVGAEVRVAVTDTGRGMHHEALTRLLHSADDACTYVHRTPQAALGLSGTRQLVERMGGRLEAHSFEGTGSVFTVALRAAEPH